MAKASLALPDGTKVDIQGSADEVAALLARFAQPLSPTSSRSAVATRSKDGRSKDSKAKRKGGPVGHILRLRDEGFFKTRRSLPDIQRKLEEDGHIYAQSSLSPTLIRLTRRREIRRIRDKKGWVYVN